MLPADHSGPETREDKKKSKKITQSHHVDGPYYVSDYDPCIDSNRRNFPP